MIEPDASSTNNQHIIDAEDIIKRIKALEAQMSASSESYREGGRMNWKEFKEYVESRGITDDMKLKRIDLSDDEMDFKYIDVLLNIPGGVVII